GDAPAPRATPAAPAPSPAASPAPAAAPQPSPTVEATPPPDDQGENEPSAEDAALEDDPAQEMQPAPQTEQDQVYRSIEYRQETETRQPLAPTTIDAEPSPVPKINYETSGPAGGRAPCERTIKAHVVALDQVFFWNRLGAVQPHGMIFALRHHVVPTDGTNSLKPGKVRLRADKRPRPLVLRMNVGDCLQIDFQNLLAPDVRDNDQPATRTASVHVAGLQLVNSIRDDGSNVGRNPSPPGGLVRPGERITYTLYADARMREGTHVLFSAAATTTAEGDGGQIPPGLFGAVNVEPRGAEWYRSQLSHNDLRLATRRNPLGQVMRTAGGQPVINYDAVYPSWHRYRRQPILKILNRHNVIVHADLTAIITGPGRGKFPAGTYPPSSVAAPNRDWPFREHTIIYHDEIGAVQAFPQFEQDGRGQLGPTLHGSRDAFAINYGSGGIGAEILANRLGVGPMAGCDECLFEEFFLSSWTVGDPAMVVDVPANAPCKPSRLEEGECHPNQSLPTPGPKATKAFYPHDPSNVYHGYLGDRTKQRVLHAGPKEHHIHHLHAHQWFKAADAEGSSYNDSQGVGPGSGHNIEIAYGGGGNRNLTPGDSIFHCHFYPHFAQGMWALWRVHDVFEEGTVLDGGGRPAQGARALPDAEILRGTPIPAVVPIPGGAAPNMADYVMPPAPKAQVQIVNGQIVVNGDGNPGFPFFVPGIMGRRAPHPPYDTVFDAGLPRHIILDADVAFHEETRLSFDKGIEKIDAQELPEKGTRIEKFAMDYHAMDFHPSFRTDGTPGPFMTNGLPPVEGAPFADPCTNHRWTAQGQRILTADPFGRQIYYKGVMFQFDMTINKKGWHFPQSRVETLWADWQPTVAGTKPPEPLFFRANTNDCVTFHHANLIPKVYRVDDFQVRTPTDIVGQHIHLVKFDVTASDGAANGWNYEDGTFGDEEVVSRIQHINERGGIRTEGGGRRPLSPVSHPFFGKPTQVTIQRWLVDNIAGDNTDPNRTLRNAFTHDHFAPSTHQQTGLYAGLIIEPLNSDWLHNETGARLGYGNSPTPVRPLDGGPTSWQAVILPPDQSKSYREFLIEFADFQLAYMKGRGVDAQGRAVPDPEGAINPPGRLEVALPTTVPAPGGPFGPDTRLLERPARRQCPTGDPAPCPEIISADDPGTFSVNYRNEPIPLRVRDPNTNTQVPGTQGDLSHVYRSIARVDPDLNNLGPYPQLTADLGPYDPFTPLLRAYENDEVQVRVLVGAHEEGHNFSINGVKWLFEPFDPNSGYRNSQMMGISEKYDFIIPKTPKNTQTTDFLYRPGAASDDQWNGLWGLMRAYSSRRSDLFPLPNNPNGFGPGASNPGDFNGVCPKSAPARNYEVHAYYARDILPRARLEFTGQNGWTFSVRTPDGTQTGAGPLNDPTAILYVRKEDIGADGKYNRQRVEPLVLRAAAGDCVNLTLRNRLPDAPNDLPGYNTFPMIVDDFNANQVVPSRHVGLHPQLLFYEVKSSDGMNVGRNPVQTAAPGGSVTYQWYAGDIKIDPVTAFGTGVPIEFGATNLMSSDPVKHSNKSAIGSLVVEPRGSTWTEDPDHRHAATVWRPTKACDTCGTVMVPFREFVLQFQNDLNMRFSNNQPVPNLADAEDPEDSGQKAFNYRTEPFWTRLCYWPALPLTGADGTVTPSCPNAYAQATRQFDMTDSLHNTQIGGRDPVTPIFTAMAGDEVRFRVLHSGGHARNNVFMLHGHVWQEMPYQTGTASTVIGFNNNSPWHGSQYGHGPSNHFDVVIQRAGGAFSIAGDYLYRTFQSFQFDGGMWGLFRVGGGRTDLNVEEQCPQGCCGCDPPPVVITEPPRQ
ncbi:MAG TPA: hypothetical protein VK421_12815, partial [Pyrinomonadaceae bacterium]|nr:hypothetical protein [Pyrinomonadaceae bacterium]